MKLYGRPGSGSGVVEAAIRLTGIECEIVDLPKWPDGEPPAELLAVNPLGQVPTLVLDNGTVLTESAAICVHLADLHPSAALSPALAAPERADFLRWMFYLSANVYMTLLRSYYPHRYTTDVAGAADVRDAANARVLVEWTVFAEALGDRPFILGETLSVVDIYAAMLISWMEDLDAFCTRFPNLRALYDRVANHAGVRDVWQRHGMPL